jgi:hypothetical protein
MSVELLALAVTAREKILVIAIEKTMERDILYCSLFSLHIPSLTRFVSFKKPSPLLKP